MWLIDLTRVTSLLGLRLFAVAGVLDALSRAHASTDETKAPAAGSATGGVSVPKFMV